MLGWCLVQVFSKSLYKLMDLIAWLNIIKLISWMYDRRRKSESLHSYKLAYN